jgi:hypothetical protein
MIIDEFIKHVNEIKHKSCCKVGFSLETILLVYLGKKMCDDPPITIKGNIMDFGEYNLRFITSWRILLNNNIFTSWKVFDQLEYKKLEEDANILVGKEISSLEFNRKTFDLVINFSNDISLQIFNDHNLYGGRSMIYCFDNNRNYYNIYNNKDITTEINKSKIITLDD